MFSQNDLLRDKSSSHWSWCSFSMMVRWANDGLPQANDGKMLVNDGEMLVNDGEMSVWFTHFTIIDEHSPSLAWSIPSFAHLTIIEKLHGLHWSNRVHGTSCCKIKCIVLLNWAAGQNAAPAFQPAQQPQQQQQQFNQQQQFRQPQPQQQQSQQFNRPQGRH